MSILTKKDQVRIAAENDLETFIRVVHPGRVLGSIHQEVIKWWTREDAKSHQLTLLPRDHQKSALIAYRVAWRITKNPALRILYISGTSNLAEKQLKFIKDILTCEKYRFYWPDMVNEDEAKREKWSLSEISVDHPIRKHEAVRDPTIFTAGLTTTITGLHCDIAVLDDVVLYENAYTSEGREKVKTQYSFLASIEGTDGEEWVVGTRYHPNDLYQTLLDTLVDTWNDDGVEEEQEALYEVFERQVESMGDGTGEFLWPRQQRSDGKWFGFDQRILARKRSQYQDRLQFKAQYYNDPNDPETSLIRDFQYYDKSKVNRVNGQWFINGFRLNVFASIDFAFSKRKGADYSSIVVVGVDGNSNYYILDIDRFQTNSISEYFTRILKLHQKWDFRKIRAEVSVAQEAIVQSIKNDYIRPYGLALSVEEYRPTRNEGNKEERIEAVLFPKYHNKQIWHYQGGNCQVLEEELTLQNPPHDDVKDALASCIDLSVAPSGNIGLPSNRNRDRLKSMAHSVFGGLA
jgi:hypothetical protein